MLMLLLGLVSVTGAGSAVFSAAEEDGFGLCPSPAGIFATSCRSSAPTRASSRVVWARASRLRWEIAAAANWMAESKKLAEPKKTVG